MLSKVTAKNVGDVFLRHIVDDTFLLMKLEGVLHSLREFEDGCELLQ